MTIVGYARSKMTQDEFNNRISSFFKCSEEQKKEFLGRCHYIAETERKNIFYHFFAKIVVDTERLSLAPCTPHFLEHVFARLKITSERLFNYDAIHIVFRVAVLAQLTRHRNKYLSLIHI